MVHFSFPGWELQEGPGYSSEKIKEIVSSFDFKTAINIYISASIIRSLFTEAGKRIQIYMPAHELCNID